MSSTATIRSQIAQWVLAIWLLFSSFVFYVTFVQYALLGRATAGLGFSEKALAPGFLLLAICGIAGSLLAGFFFHRRSSPPGEILKIVVFCSGLLALCAIWAMRAESLVGLLSVFAPMGLLLGLLIVALLLYFLQVVPQRLRGLCAGAAAGMVYLTANVLASLAQNPDTIGTVDLVLILSNVVAFTLMSDNIKTRSVQPVGGGNSLLEMAVRIWPLALVVLVDTALFVHVSRAPGAVAIFATAGDWLSNGFAHLLAALLAGVFYARLGWRRLTWFASVTLLGAFFAFVVHRLGVADLSFLVILLYSATVGAYTVSLFTVFGEEAPQDAPAVGVAVGMVLVGWVCSPAGIIIGTLLLP